MCVGDAMNDILLGIDTWEGQLEIDEAVLKANNVAFIFVRLNDMNGGHHKDAGFDKQWTESQNFYRAPYFVYNPWVTGQENFNWLSANMPAEARAVAIDIEVLRIGYNPATYAAEVSKFLMFAKQRWNVAIYTGEWFLSYLSKWDQNADYWWAAYPDEFHPANDLILNWDELRTRLLKYNVPGNAAKVPGRLMFWQFSGDRLILPGNKREMDVNVFLGSLAQLESFMGAAVVAPPDIGGTMNTGKVKTVTNIRNSPPGGTYADIGDLLANDVVVADEIRIVNTYPWWHLVGWMRGTQVMTLPAGECWAYGVNISEIVTPPTSTPLPDLNITIEAVGYPVTHVNIKPT